MARNLAKESLALCSKESGRIQKGKRYIQLEKGKKRLKTGDVQIKMGLSSVGFSVRIIKTELSAASWHFTLPLSAPAFEQLAVREMPLKDETNSFQMRRPVGDKWKANLRNCMGENVAKKEEI